MINYWSFVIFLMYNYIYIYYMYIYIYCCFANMSHDSLSTMFIPSCRPRVATSSGGRVADIEPSTRTKAAGFQGRTGFPHNLLE